MIEIKSTSGEVLLKVEGADLRDANLSGANLRGADLRGANLYGANLCDADLRGANLRDANLRGANLYGANLCDADLRGANLCDVNLRDANLRDANLRGANLYGANLCDADLRGANLSGADLRGANLRDANLRGAKNIPAHVEAETLIVPQEGEIVGWKKCRDNVLVKVLVGKGAKRSNATGRKCRAEYVTVLEVIGAEFGISSFDGETTYEVGKEVRCDCWSEDRWVECGGGIHFFLTRYEAEVYIP